MTIMEMLSQSAILIVMGLGTVLAFLTLVVVVISQFGWIFKPKKAELKVETKPEVKLEIKPEKKPESVDTVVFIPPSDKDDVVAVITAAVSQYRK
jgi:sodium pump decarboxylase gamma subunit